METKVEPAHNEVRSLPQLELRAFVNTRFRIISIDSKYDIAEEGRNEEAPKRVASSDEQVFRASCANAGQLH